MIEAAEAWPFSKRCFWLVLACLAVVWEGPSFVRGLRPAVTDTRVEIFDFLQDWNSARNYLEGRPVYGSQEEALWRHLRSTRRPADPRNRFFNEVNAHPPTSVLLILPLAPLSYPTAFLVWSLLSLALGGASLWLVVRQLHFAWSPWSLLRLVAVLLVCNPFRQQMLEGQWSLVVLFLLVATWAASRSGYAGTAGVLLATATAIKLIPGFVFVYFAWRRQWKTVLAGLVTLAVLTGLTVALLGGETYRQYVQETLPSLAIDHTSWVNASLTGFWSKLFAAPTYRYLREPLWTNPMLAQGGALFSSVLVIAILFVALRRREPADELIPRAGLDIGPEPLAPGTPGARGWGEEVRPTSGRPPHPRPLSPAYRGEGSPAAAWCCMTPHGRIDAGYGLTLIAMLLVSPVTWDHYFLWLLIPLVVIWQRLPPSVLVRGLFGLILVLLWIQPQWLWDLAIPGSWLYGTARPWQTLTVLSAQFYALVALFVLGVCLIGRPPCKKDGTLELPRPAEENPCA